MKKSTAAMLAAALVILLYVLLRSGEIPARVTLINASGTALTDVVLTGGNRSVSIALLHNGETHTATLQSGAHVVITFRGEAAARHRWTSPEPLSPYKAMVLTVNAAGEVRPAARALAPDALH